MPDDTCGMPKSDAAYGDAFAPQKKGFTIEKPSQGPVVGDALPMDTFEQASPEKDVIEPWPESQEKGISEGMETPIETQSAENHNGKDIFEVLCFSCENPIPIYTDERPLYITCPHCGQEGEIG